MPNIIDVIARLIAGIFVLNKEVQWLAFIGQLLLAIITADVRKVPGELNAWLHIDWRPVRRTG